MSTKPEGHINVNPLKPPTDWADPKYRYLPPDGGIGSDPVVYINNLVMLVLDANCPPSPNGIYYKCEISAAWEGWLKAHPHFKDVAHIEHAHNEITGERKCYLWKLSDWRDTASARKEQSTNDKRSETQWWDMRYRVYRSILRLYNMMDCGWKTACQSIQEQVSMHEKLSKLDAEIAKQSCMFLTLTRFWDPIENEALESFKDVWRSAPGHLYDSPLDITNTNAAKLENIILSNETQSWG